MRKIVLAIALLVLELPVNFAQASGIDESKQERCEASAGLPAQNQTHLPSSVTRLAQVLGNRCFTQDGWCWTNPAPVGSLCFCGDTQGQVGQ
jgi:hypothetical protein